MQHWVEYWGIFTTALGTVVAWFAGRRTRVAEAKKVESDALTSMQETYDKFVHDLGIRYDELKKEMVNLKFEVDKQRNEIIELTSKNRVLTQEVHEWEVKYTRLLKQMRHEDEDH
jgi:FtsZ-binding cell division protein ZapB